jgi:hypothetical protein
VLSSLRRCESCAAFFTRISRLGHARCLPHRLASTVMTTSGRATSACRDTRGLFGESDVAIRRSILPFYGRGCPVGSGDPSDRPFDQKRRPSRPRDGQFFGYWASSGCLSGAERSAFSESPPGIQKGQCAGTRAFRQNLCGANGVSTSRWWPVTCVCDTPITRKCGAPSKAVGEEGPRALAGSRASRSG